MNAEEFKKQFKKKLGFGFNKGPLNLNSSIKSNQYYKIIKLKTLFIKEF
jgi:CTP-dependent riboflavin kinase